MKYDIKMCDGYLRAEMVERETGEETREFVHATFNAFRAHKARKLLVSISRSLPLYKVTAWDLSGAIECAKRIKGFKLALVSDSREMATSHEYIALLSRQRGLECKVFGSESSAVAWLTEQLRTR
ncbi:MAG: hypothetical protein ACREUX_18305 [Burkholderiales bacterium]